MSYELNPECFKCKVKESPIWKKTPEGEICNSCAKANNDSNNDGNNSNGSCKEREQNNLKPSSQDNNNRTKLTARRSARNTKIYKTRLNPYALPKPAAPKGKGRRIIFKKSSTKAPTAVATPVTCDYVFYKGSYIQVGDIVSMIDVSGDVYYAQIRGLLQDQYCEKSAVVTWLLPTQSSPPPEEGFDPSTYIIGPEEDIPRRLSCMEFIMHAPSEYFKAKNSPYPPLTYKPDSGFIWTRLGPHRVSPPRVEDIEES